jgi:hypothetical protein
LALETLVDSSLSAGGVGDVNGWERIVITVEEQAGLWDYSGRNY